MERMLEFRGKPIEEQLVYLEQCVAEWDAGKIRRPSPDEIAKIREEIRRMKQRIATRGITP